MPVDGWVDAFAPPGTLAGWATAVPPSVGGACEVVVRLSGEPIGRAARTIHRPDIAGPDQMVGYRVTTTAPVSFRDFAEGRVEVALQGPGFRGALRINQDLLERARLIAVIEDLIGLGFWSEGRLDAVAQSIIADPTLPRAMRERMRSLAAQPGATPDGASLLRALMARAMPDRTAGRPEPAGHLLEHFASLGVNCEFGALQRNFGHEPISLLRWAYSPIDRLIAALDHDLDGVGDPEFTEFMELRPGDDFVTRDRRYDFTIHTFTWASQIGDYDMEFRRHCARLSWLRRALLEDLREGRKVLVRWELADVGLPVIRRLFHALRRHGPNRLLFVLDDPARAGRVTEIEDGLLVGFIDRFVPPGRLPHDLSIDAWMTICAKAATQFGLRDEPGPASG